MLKHYFGLEKNGKVVQTYEIAGITKKAAANKLLIKTLSNIESLGAFKYQHLTKSEHIEFQHKLVQEKLQQQMQDTFTLKMNEVLSSSAHSKGERLETYIAERDLDDLSNQLMKGLQQAFKAITLNGFIEKPHYRHLQFILMDMHNDIGRLKAVVPEKEGQVKVLATIIRELRLVLTIAKENPEEFDCYELFVLFSTFETYYGYVD